jgi:transketolase C-terminal domain/subunit
MKLPKVFSEEHFFVPGKCVLLREGTDVTLVSTGYMTHFAIQAARGLSVIR